MYSGLWAGESGGRRKSPSGPGWARRCGKWKEKRAERHRSWTQSGRRHMTDANSSAKTTDRGHQGRIGVRRGSWPCGGIEGGNKGWEQRRKKRQKERRRGRLRQQTKRAEEARLNSPHVSGRGCVDAHGAERGSAHERTKARGLWYGRSCLGNDRGGQMLGMSAVCYTTGKVAFWIRALSDAASVYGARSV